MITLTGTLRQAGEVTFKDKPPRLKVVVEHETARENGQSDLRLETLFLAPEEAAKVEVRPYPNGKTVAFAAVRLVAAADGGDPLPVS